MVTNLILAKMAVRSVLKESIVILIQIMMLLFWQIVDQEINVKPQALAINLCVLPEPI